MCISYNKTRPLANHALIYALHFHVHFFMFFHTLKQSYLTLNSEFETRAHNSQEMHWTQHV